MRATIEHAGEDEIDFPPVKGKFLLGLKANGTNLFDFPNFKTSYCNH